MLEYDVNTNYLPLVYRNPWPSECYPPGTENYLAPNPDIPQITLQQGTTITVTTTADIDGDVSGVQELISNPGPDGIALRVAIEATNVDPGQCTVNFSPALDGSTIYTGEHDNADLPPLLGGSLIINGDCDIIKPIISIPVVAKDLFNSSDPSFLKVRYIERYTLKALPPKGFIRGLAYIINLCR